jgi:high affinity choline transporter 7
VAVPFVLAGVGGLDTAWLQYVTARPEGSGVVPMPASTGMWTPATIVSWWDVSVMLMLGGIPWNCYFQRVLSCETPGKAKGQSIVSGLLTMAFTIPPLLMGIAAFSYPWSADIAARLQITPAETLPMLFAHAVPPLVGMLGLAAIVGAVTSSFSSSILSAGSMLSWNCLRRIVWPGMSVIQMARAIRGSILLFGGLATALALKVQSVQALWFFTSDLVFVLLFPQLVFALYDPKANRIGSMAAFGISLALRVGGGEPLLGIPQLLPYPETWPVRIAAAGAGVILLPVVSRLTTRWAPSRPLRNLEVVTA